MSDRFDEQANAVVIALLDTIYPRPQVVAAALRSTDAAAERRGELKGLEWCLKIFALSRNSKQLRARIAELKKGGA